MSDTNATPASMESVVDSNSITINIVSTDSIVSAMKALSLVSGSEKMDAFVNAAVVQSLKNGVRGLINAQNTVYSKEMRTGSREKAMRIAERINGYESILRGL